MGLLRYRIVIAIGRRSGPLLVGLTTGALLVGVVAMTQPAEVLPAGWDAALGAETALPAPAATSPTGIGPTSGTGSTTGIGPPGTAPGDTGANPTAAAATSPAVPDPTKPAAPVVDAAAATTAPTTRATAPRTTAPRAAPTSTRRPAPVAAVSGSQAAQVVALTNRARAQAGCAALRVDARLTAAAQGHSDDMSAHRYFAHDSQDGRSFADRIIAQDYPSPGGENIAQGQQNAREVVTAWLNSPGHRRNIEDCSFTTIGVGLAGAGEYWTQDFGR